VAKDWQFGATFVVVDLEDLSLRKTSSHQHKYLFIILVPNKINIIFYREYKINRIWFSCLTNKDKKLKN